MTLARPPRRLVRSIVGAALVMATVGIAAVAAFGIGGIGGESTEKPRTAAVSTTTVTRQTLVDRIKVDGKIAYGEPVPIASTATGTVTWLPAAGTVISRGETVLRVDDQPVVLLYGALPMYRQLSTNLRGDDVKQFEENLKALGFSGFTVDTQFDTATAAAVKRWQKKLNRAETGVVEPADVVYAAGPLRVAKQSVRVGAKAAAEVLQASGTTRLVQAGVSAATKRIAKVHNQVTVVLPDGRQVPGEVAAVGPAAGDAVAGPPENRTGADAAKGPAGGAGDDTSILITVADQTALGAAAEAGVTVQYIAESRPNVLTVSVHALLALDSGYGLEIHEGSGRRTVPVTVGLFADGQVEVSGDGIAEGTTVGAAG